MIEASRHVGALVVKIQRPFLERPELKLTAREVQERFGLDNVLCESLLDVLVDAKVLTRTRDGAYLRFFPRRDGDPAQRGVFRTARRLPAGSRTGRTTRAA